MSKHKKLFRFSGWDIVHVSVLALNGVATVWLAATYASLSVATLAGAAVLLAVAQFTAHQGVHYFIHTPFFSSRRLNRAYAMVQSGVQGTSVTRFDLFHRFHHGNVIDYSHMRLREMLGFDSLKRAPLVLWYHFVDLSQLLAIPELRRWLRQLENASDAPPVPVVAETRSWGHYRRQSVPHQVALARRRGVDSVSRQLIAETAASVLFAATLVALSWKFYLFCYLPARFLCTFFAAVQEYNEHLEVTSLSDRKRDAVSSYNPLYHLLTLNSGYHQEHSLRPGVHWKKLPTIREELPGDQLRRVVPVGIVLGTLFNRRVQAPVVAAR